MSSVLSVGLLSGATCHKMVSIAHVEKGHARGGLYTWVVPCGSARHFRDAWSAPRTMSVATTTTI